MFMKKFEECKCIKKYRWKFIPGNNCFYRKITLESGKRFYYVCSNIKENLGLLIPISKFREYFIGNRVIDNE